MSPLDGSSRPLSAKLLERPRLLDQIRSLVPDPDRAHLVPFNTTELERDLALALGIPMYGADPRFFPYGTKTGCRRLFAEQGVRHPLGREDLSTTAELAAAIAELRAERPGMSQVIVKLNEGVSGEGNALLSLEGLIDGAGTDEIEERLAAMQFELPEITYDGYTDMLEKRGGVVEERIVGEEFRSPSVQMRVTPLGKLEVLSTHDQLLGGPSGQSYLGCIFPADPGLRDRDHAGGGEGRRAARVGGRDRPFRDGLRRRQGRGRRAGSRTRSSSTSARGARPTRSSRCSSSRTARTTRRRRCSRPRAASRSSSSPPTMSRATCTAR